MARKTLTQDDVHRLMADPSGANRAETAAKIAGEFGAEGLSASERKLAEEIFRVMVRDAEVRVREALSVNLKENPAVPKDVALALAKDVDEVALPMLSFSEVFSDDDLIEIIQTSNSSKQQAIAGRERVSETVSDALVDTDNEDVVAKLVSNKGAKISADALGKVVDNLGGSEAVQGAMVRRAGLPVRITERLLNMVSDQMKEELAKSQALPGGMAADLIHQSRERATILLSGESTQEQLERMIENMHVNNRLTPSIMLRSLCMGDLNFYETALARLTRLPIENVRQLVHDSGPLGLKAIYEKAGLPREHFTAVRAAVDVADEMEYDGEDNDRERYSRRMIERILTQYGDLGVEFEADDLEYLLSKMNDLRDHGGGMESGH